MSRKNRLNSEDAAHNTEELAESTAIDEEATPVVNSPSDASRVDEVVAKWVSSLRGSPLSRNSQAWNYLQSRLPDLVAALKE